MRIETADGKNYSGTLIKVKNLDIVLWAYDAIIDIEEIVSIRIVYSKDNKLTPGLIPALLENRGTDPIFYMDKWRLFIKKNE